jgi:hypothetical protein
MKTIGNKANIFESIDAKGYADYGYASTVPTSNPGVSVWTKAALGLGSGSIFDQFTFITGVPGENYDLRYDNPAAGLVNITADILLISLSSGPIVIGYNLGRKVDADYVPYANFNTKFEILNPGEKKWVQTELTQAFENNQRLNILVQINTLDAIGIGGYELTAYII